MIWLPMVAYRHFLSQKSMENSTHAVKGLLKLTGTFVKKKRQIYSSHARGPVVWVAATSG